MLLPSGFSPNCDVRLTMVGSLSLMVYLKLPVPVAPLNAVKVTPMVSSGSSIVSSTILG